MSDIIKHCCGTCAKWTPKSTMEEILETKRRGMPLCTVTGEIRGPDAEAGCFLWKQAEAQEIERREKAGLIKDVISSSRTSPVNL